jgi:hypothetical protein
MDGDRRREDTQRHSESPSELRRSLDLSTLSLHPCIAFLETIYHLSSHLVPPLLWVSRSARVASLFGHSFVGGLRTPVIGLQAATR